MARTYGVAPLIGQSWQMNGFIRLYKEVFGSSPYEERYSDDWIRENVWDHHLKHGTIVLGEDDSGKIVGLACAVRLVHAPSDVQEFLKSAWMNGELPEELVPDKTWYLSELGVSEVASRSEVAYQLIRNRLLSASHAGMVHYVTRTDPKNSVSRNLYEKVGATVLKGEQDMTTTPQVTLLGSHSTRRIYLFGRASEALHKVTSVHASEGTNAC